MLSNLLITSSEFYALLPILLIIGIIIIFSIFKKKQPTVTPLEQAMNVCNEIIENNSFDAERVKGENYVRFSAPIEESPIEHKIRLVYHIDIAHNQAMLLFDFGSILDPNVAETTQKLFNGSQDGDDAFGLLITEEYFFTEDKKELSHLILGKVLPFERIDTLAEKFQSYFALGKKHLKDEMYGFLFNTLTQSSYA